MNLLMMDTLFIRVCVLLDLTIFVILTKIEQPFRHGRIAAGTLDINTGDTFLLNSSTELVKEFQYTGIRLYKNRIFVTTFLSRVEQSQSATLFEVSRTQDGQDTVFKPYPSADVFDKEDCNKFQFISAFEIDPSKGWMWIVDTGLHPFVPSSVPSTKCRAKIVIFDINYEKVIRHSYEFPYTVTGNENFYLRHMVLDIKNGTFNYAYISDVYDWKLVVFDKRLNHSYMFSHPVMDGSPDKAVNITVGDSTQNINELGISGLAMAPGYSDVYFSSVSNERLFSVPTTILRDYKYDSIDFTTHLKEVDSKLSMGDPVVMSRDGVLIYATLNYSEALLVQMSISNKDKNKNQVVLLKQDRLAWVSSITIDGDQNLWYMYKYSHSSKSLNIFKMRTKFRSYLDLSEDKSGHTSDGHPISLNFVLFILLPWLVLLAYTFINY